MSNTPNTPSLLALEGLMLVSAWKPIVLLAPWVAWAWFVSTVLDKHAARFHLGRDKWNMTHLSMGTVALLAAFLIPGTSHVAFGIALGVVVLILSTDIMIYAISTNKDERVPEKFKIRFDASTWKQAKEEKALAKRAGKAELQIQTPGGTTVAVPMSDSEEFPVRVAAEGIYMQAKAARASQVDIAPGRDKAYVVSSVVDGVRKVQRQSIPPAEAVRLIDFWKSAAELDLSDRRRPRWADITVSRHELGETVRVSTAGGPAGMRLGMLFDPSGAVRRGVEDLGLTEPQLAELRAITEERRGVVLLGAAADNGRTTTLYTLAKMHDAYTSNVQTLEFEMQSGLEGVRQSVFDPQGEGPEFSTFMRSILRRDPDVVVVAEVPDNATVIEMCKNDHGRTRVYASLKAEGAVRTVATFVKAAGDNEIAGNALYGVMSWKLMRRLCQNCKVPYQPSPEMLSKLGLPAAKVKQLFKKGGQVLIKNKPDTCPTCLGSGYFGQIGAFEVYRLGEDERALIRGGDLNGLRTALRKKGLPTIQQVALLRAVEGITSVEEVTRITAPKQNKPSPAVPVA